MNIVKSKLKQYGHVIRIKDDRIPKNMFQGERDQREDPEPNGQTKQDIKTEENS